MQVRLTSISGQIGIRTHDAYLSVHRQEPVLSLRTKPASLNMHTEHPRAKIDQSECFSELGLKVGLELNRDYAARGRDAVLQGIARIVDEGNRMAAIENGGTLPELAFEKAFPPPAEVMLAMLPQSRPKIDFEGGVYFEPERGGVDISFQPSSVELTWTNQSVDVFMRRKPELLIDFVGNNLDVRV